MEKTTAWLRQHSAKLIILFGGVLAPLYLFGSFAEEVLEREAFAFDEPILLFMHAHTTPLFDAVMLFFTRIGSVYALVPFNLAVLLFLLYRKRRAEALFWTLATCGAWLLNYLAKHTFVRVRPDLWVSISPETTFSFPSGHAMHSMATVAALLYLICHHRRNWPAIFIGIFFVAMVGLSRVYLGVHYPSDIAAGWAASVAWVAGLGILFQSRWAVRGTPRMV
jgi:membrane-associated phospholipid phosphatase